MYNFDAKKVKDECIKWIQNFFENAGKDCNAIIGLSGGKDSSIVAALCVEALGKERVIGVGLPNIVQISNQTYTENQKCIELLVNNLGIKYIEIPISGIYCEAIAAIQKGTKFEKDISRQTLVNLAPRLRMTMLYAVSQSYNGRVANTCNLSEDWVGWATRWGDSVGDFSPLSKLTVTEVRAVGYELSHILPKGLVDKVPSDDLCGKTDEDNFGFSYDVLDKYIRTSVCENQDIKAKIDELHSKNLFKMKPMPTFELPE